MWPPASGENGMILAMTVSRPRARMSAVTAAILADDLLVTRIFTPRGHPTRPCPLHAGIRTRGVSRRPEICHRFHLAVSSVARLVRTESATQAPRLPDRLIPPLNKKVSRPTLILISVWISVHRLSRTLVGSSSYLHFLNSKVNPSRYWISRVSRSSPLLFSSGRNVRLASVEFLADTSQ